MGSESGAATGDSHSGHRQRVRHRKRLPWFFKQQSRRMKVLIVIAAGLALWLAFALVEYMEAPSSLPPQ